MQTLEQIINVVKPLGAVVKDIVSLIASIGTGNPVGMGSSAIHLGSSSIELSEAGSSAIDSSSAAQGAADGATEGAAAGAETASSAK